MALAKCPSCNHDVSREAKTCPQCGHPLSFRREPSATRGWGGMIIAMLIGAAALTVLASPVIAQEDWINRDCNRYGASVFPSITPGSLSPDILEKLRQKYAPKIEAARQECEWRKQQQKEAKAAEQARQAAAEREREREAQEQAAERERQAQEQAAERERQAQERERQRQAYEALPAHEKAALAAAAAAQKAEQEAATLAREAALRKQMVMTRLLDGYRFYAHVKWCYEVRDGYLVKYINDAELERAETAIKAIAEQAAKEDASIDTDDVWKKALKALQGKYAQDELCKMSLHQLFKMSPKPVYHIEKP